MTGDSYGLSIRQELQRLTGRDIAIGSVYRSLAGLERKGLIRSWTGEPTPVRGGRAKKYFEATGAGAKALKRTLHDLRALTGSLELGAEPA